MAGMAQVRCFPGVSLQQVETRFDPEFGVYWAFMRPRGRPCFTEALLADLQSYIGSIASPRGTWMCESDASPVRYGVLASKCEGVFNLGGDLELFRAAIERGDRAALLRYGELCIDNLHPWHTNCGLDITTMSLVQGNALGGGFEAALSATVVIAEDGAKMGFPEILFNLFPGMGAYSFLSRKVGRRVADELVTSGTLYSARQLYDLGVVDVVTPDGTGEVAVYDYIRKHAKNGNGRRAYERARLQTSQVERSELARVVEVWADAALRLTDRDIRMMDRLVRAQQRTVASPENAATGPANVVPLARTASIA